MSTGNEAEQNYDAIRDVTGQLREHVASCRRVTESRLGGEAESSYWGERGRLWAQLADGADTGLFQLLDMGVDIRALIAREVAMRAGEARLLAAIAELPDGGDFLAARQPVTVTELVVDAELAADIDAAGSPQ